MLDGYVIIVLLLIIIIALIIIYNNICFIGIIIRIRNYKELNDNEIKQKILSENFSLNLWWIIIRKIILNSNDSASKLEKSKHIINTINFISTNILIKILSILFAIFITMYAMSMILKAASSIFIVIADECTCFVQCSGDSADDSKSPYELVFGTTKWNNLKTTYKKYATVEDYENFEAFTTGKEIGYWCIGHINEEVVEQFRQDCLSRDIVKLDGYNVSTMTKDQITNQFKKLMKDYKENGRGAECPVCSDYSSKLVYLICSGIHQYVAPWSFQSISDETDGIDLGNIVFIGDSRTIDMFYDSDDTIWGEEHDEIEIYAKHGGSFSWLEEVYSRSGIDDDTNTIVTWMGANDNGNTSQYESFYRAAMDAGIRVIICTVGPTDDNYLEDGDKADYANSKMIQYNDSIKDWANNNGVTVIDVYSFIESTSTVQIDQSDGIHYYPRPTTEIWDYILGRIKVLTSGGVGTSPGGGQMGHATGKYAVQLDDGMYYWYHQGSDHCVNCDEWSSRTWGKSGTETNFNINGCGVYSLACIVSNLYDGEVTPTELMNKFGVGTSSGTKYVTSSSSVFTNAKGLDIRRFTAMTIIKNTYGLEYSSLDVSSSTTTEQIQYIDDILSKGGVVWSHWIDAQCDWCSKGTRHFMGIRKSDGSNYYCFTSTASKKTSGGRQGAIDTMNMPLSKQAVVSSLEQDTNVLIGIWNPNAGSSGGGGQGGYNLSASDTELINWFKSDLGVSEKKAYGMLACYKAATEAGLSTYETVGLLGCAMAEGSPALVQYGFSVDGYGKSTQNNPLIINTTDKANAWINNIVKSRGCGTAQWTDTLYKGNWSYRGRTYIEYVKKYTTDTPCDYKTLWSADYDMYKMELTGGYKGLVTDMPNHNSSVESITVFSMFKYEAGWGNYKNSDRIADYSGTFKSYLDARYKNATAVDTMFRKHAK